MLTSRIFLGAGAAAAYLPWTRGLTAPTAAKESRGEGTWFVLGTIHDTGYRDPIGMEMSPKSDPAEAFKAIRRVDALAREING